MGDHALGGAWNFGGVLDLFLVRPSAGIWGPLTQGTFERATLSSMSRVDAKCLAGYFPADTFLLDS